MSESIDIGALWGDLTDSEKEAWQQIQNTLGSPGWKIVVRDFEELGDSLSSQIFNAQNWDQYVFIRGQLDAIRHVLNVGDRVAFQLQNAVNERTPEAEVDEQLVLPSEDFA